MNTKDKAKIEGHIEEILTIMGLNLTDPNIRETPHRIAKMWCDEVFSSEFKGLKELNKSMTLFPAPSHNMVTLTDIPFSSMCSHHFMPFFGKVDVSYIPRDTIIGLSKIPRVIKWFSKKPQVQEKLTKEIGEYLFKILNPKYLYVRIHDTTHTCIMCRGIELPANTETFWNKKADDYRVEEVQK